MYNEAKNEYGCSLENQDGRMAVRDFDTIVARLSPELRAAFEAERAARWAELEALRAAEASARGAQTADAASRPTRRGRLARALGKLGGFGAARLIVRLLRMILQRGLAARSRVLRPGLAVRMLPEIDQAAPAAADSRCAAARRPYRRWSTKEPRNHAICDGSQGCWRACTYLRRC